MGAGVFVAFKENINKKEDKTIQKTKTEEKEYLKLKEKGGWDHFISNKCWEASQREAQTHPQVYETKWGSYPSHQKERYAGTLQRVEGSEATQICVSSVEVGDDMTHDNNENNAKEEINISAVLKNII